MPRLFSRRIRTHNQLRDQFLRQLEREAEKILSQMTKQFTENLGKQLEQALQSSMGSVTTRSGSTDNGFSIGGFNLGGFGNLFTSAVSVLVSRPHVSRSTRESSRSQAMANAFRLSRSQAAAEATQVLTRSDKNR